MQDAMGHRVRCNCIRVSRTGTVVPVADNLTLLSCGVIDRDTIFLETTNTPTPSATSSTVVTSTSTAVINEDMEVASPNESLSQHCYFLDSITRSSLIPCSPLEAVSLASHAIILQMGFVCISERPDPNAVPGFAPPLSGK